MALVVILLLWLLNLGISIWNGVVTGKVWVEAKHAGGGRRFMAWMGAIMCAIGFTWCLLVLESIVAYKLQWLDLYWTEWLLSTGYVLIVPPLLFAGYAIMFKAWSDAYRSHWKAQNVAVAGYDTFVNVYNTYQVVQGFGDAFGKMLEGFTKNMGKSKDSGMALLALLLLIVAVGGGIMIAYWLINKFAADDEPLPLRSAEPGYSTY